MLVKFIKTVDKDKYCLWKKMLSYIKGITNENKSFQNRSFGNTNFDVIKTKGVWL